MRPILVVGDSPDMPTGLARIARDICAHLHHDQEKLGVRVAQLGLGYEGRPFAWPVFRAGDLDWAALDVQKVWEWWGKGEPGIIFTVWDPSRCFPIATLPRKDDVKLWGYFAVDAENRDGKFGGPALDALHHYDRLLAYTRFGRKVIAASLELTPDDQRLAWLPHGFHPQFRPMTPDEVIDCLAALGVPGELIQKTWVGCVAANQARKDLGTFFAAVELLKQDYGQRKAIDDLLLWLHVDKSVTAAWSIPELAAIYGFDAPDKLLVTEGELSDDTLACLYSKCHATFAPGLGEGFGYPIVESLACGVPVVHVDYAGGAEICPPQWLVQPAGWRVEGPYALKRPVLSGWDVAEKLGAAIGFQDQDQPLAEAYCQGSVANLAWPYLWREWRKLLKGWIEEDFRA